MCHERIIRRAEIDEPVPLQPLLEENGDGVERAGDHGRPLVGDKVALGDDPHIPDLAKHGVALDVHSQIDPLPRRRLQVEVQDVLVAWVVDGLQRPPHPQAVPLGALEEVRDPRRLGVGVIRIDGGIVGVLVVVIAGGVIPPQDYQFLYDAGVAGIYGPGTVIAKAALEILGKLSE